MMMKQPYWFFAGFILVCSAPGASRDFNLPPQSPPQARTLFPSDREVREFIRAYVDIGQARGIVVGILEPNGRRRVINYGEAGEGARPLGPNSVFEIGSIGKTFTAAILADMVRRGEVRLEEPVSRYLPPNVRVPSKDGREITLLDLATHTSGLPRLPTGYIPPDPANPYADFDAEHLYEFLGQHQLERDPGSTFLYSNLGMGLLGHALARAVKAESFPALVQSRILRPLRMRMTRFGRPPGLAEWMTRGHRQGGAQVPHWDVGVLAGAGGLNSNVNDMLTFLGAHVGSPTSPLEQAMRDALRAYRPGPGPESQMGLAWARRGRGGQTLISHNGGTAGYSTYFALDPASGAGVVVLANSGGFDYADFIGRELLNPKRRSEVPIAPHAQQPYVGTYRLRAGLDLRITSENGRLFGQATNQPKWPLFAEATDRLFFRNIDGQLHFTRGASGKVTAVTFRQGAKELNGLRLE